MGQSTDAKIAFGVDFGEDTEFPWNAYDGEITEWWRELHGFVSPVPTPDWSSARNRTPEYDAQCSAYFKAQRDWDAAHPIPVDVIDHCSGDYPMTILAVPGTLTTASRGYPVVADRLYARPGDRVPPEAPVLERQALHARGLEFRHPSSDEQLQFDAPVPEDLQSFTAWLRRERVSPGRA